MMDEIEIVEHAELLKQIVAEKGYYGYACRYQEILLTLITPTTTYEKLSDESKAILRAQMRLNEEQVKQLAHLLTVVRPKERVAPNSLAYIRDILLIGGQFSPFPEEQRVDALCEYIDFLGISLKALMAYDDPLKKQDMPLYLKHAIGGYYEERYSHYCFHGFLSLFDGLAKVDAPLHAAALRWEASYVKEQPVPLGTLKTRLHRFHYQFDDYLRYLGKRISLRVEDVCRYSEYIYLDFDKLGELQKSDGKIYSQLYDKIDKKCWGLLGREKLLEYKKVVSELSTQLKDARIGSTGAVGKWKSNLKDRISKIGSDIDKQLGNSRSEALNGKMKLYLLQKLTTPIFGEEAFKKQNAGIRRLFAAILGSTYNIVRQDATRLTKDNLEYKRYKLQAKQIESIYNLVDGLDDKVDDKRIMIDSIVEDLIPVLPPPIDSKEERLKVFKEYVFNDPELEKKVRRQIEDM